MAQLNKYLPLFRSVLKIKCSGRLLSTRPPSVIKASFLSNPIVVGLGIGAGTAIGYQYYTQINTEPVFNEMGNTQPVLESFPEGIKVSRKV